MQTMATTTAAAHHESPGRLTTICEIRIEVKMGILLCFILSAFIHSFVDSFSQVETYYDTTEFSTAALFAKKVKYKTKKKLLFVIQIS